MQSDCESLAHGFVIVAYNTENRKQDKPTRTARNRSYDGILTRIDFHNHDYEILHKFV